MQINQTAKCRTEKNGQKVTAWTTSVIRSMEEQSKIPALRVTGNP